MSLLDSLFQLLAPQLEGVELRRAWGPGWGSRLVRGPVVGGEVLSARWAGQSQETQVRLTVFAPEASQRRETAEVLEAAVRQCCPGCVELCREGEREDSQTRLGCLPLRLTFGSGGVAGLEVKLGGKTYPAAGAAVTSTFSGTPLTAVGEEEPFAWQDAQWSYQVELTGIHVPGLERMAAFTAEIGNDVYTGCRWKKLDPAGGKAVFQAAGRQGKEELA